MKFINTTFIIICTLALFSTTAVSQDNTDRAQINQTMTHFFKWDLEGGLENANKALSKTVLYHRINEKGEHVTNTPENFDWDGKGAEAHQHNIVDIDIYNDMAIVTSLIRYNPQSPRNTYMKTFILYKLSQGWRITNVTWGRVSNQQ